MPLHEYQCDACGHRFEAIQKFSDPPITICPKCGSAVRKLISSPAFQFKGTGWYITDYAKKDQGGKEKSGRDQGGKDQSGKESGKETGKEKGSNDAASADKGAGQKSEAAPKSESTPSSPSPAPSKDQ